MAFSRVRFVWLCHHLKPVEVGSVSFDDLCGGNSQLEHCKDQLGHPICVRATHAARGNGGGPVDLGAEDRHVRRHVKQIGQEEQEMHVGDGQKKRLACDKHTIYNQQHE